MNLRAWRGPTYHSHALYYSDTLHQTVVVVQARLHDAAPSTHFPRLGLRHYLTAAVPFELFRKFEHGRQLLRFFGSVKQAQKGDAELAHLRYRTKGSPSPSNDIHVDSLAINKSRKSHSAW